MREFKVGDLVESEDFGKGIVVKSEYHTQIYPIHVRFEGNLVTQVFTKDGRWSTSDTSPSISHIEPDTPKEEKKSMANIFVASVYLFILSMYLWNRDLYVAVSVCLLGWAFGVIVSEILEERGYLTQNKED